MQRHCRNDGAGFREPSPRVRARIRVDRKKIAQFCRRWKVAELALFGSVLREDFQPGSDVDVLVAFAPDAQWGLFDHVEMADELASILGRKVDLVSRRAVERSENWVRRNSILGSAEPLYGAR